MAISLTAQHLAQAGAAQSYEPQRANNAVLVIDGLTDWGEGDPVMLALESFPLPKENNAQIEARYMNERRKFAGPANVDDMEVSVKDMVDVDVAHALLRWRRQVYLPSSQDQFQFGGEIGNLQEQGGIGLARHYKRTGRITLLAPNGEPDYSREWRVEGVWPMSMDPGDIDMTSEDFIRVSVTLSVDRIYAANLKTGG